MAIVQLAPQVASDAGVAPEYTTPLATTDTYKVDNTAPFILHFKKTGAGACNVAFTSPSVNGERGAVSKTVQVPATTGDVMVGPFDPNDFNNVNDVVFTVSEVTGLSVAIIQLPFTHRKR